jgi:hypothetical protein
MPKYLLSVHGREDATREPMSEEEMRDAYAPVQRLEQEMRSVGVFVFGGRLYEPDTATVVRMSNGSVVTTDGPFMESKEHLGGFYIIDADDLDTALEWAGRVTDLIKEPIELRPFAAESEG